MIHVCKLFVLRVVFVFQCEHRSCALNLETGTAPSCLKLLIESSYARFLPVFYCFALHMLIAALDSTRVLGRLVPFKMLKIGKLGHCSVQHMLYLAYAYCIYPQIWKFMLAKWVQQQHVPVSPSTVHHQSVHRS